MNFLTKTAKHFNTVMTHKRWVMYYARKAGITWRGIKHDLSKFSPIEFWESVKYYQGNRSPIDACKEANGYSKAWLHHRGRNSHHYEYWTDNYDNGGMPLIMPFEDAVELLCDYLAAGRAYMGPNFTYSAEYEWWKNKSKKPLMMHPAIKLFIASVLYKLTVMDKLDKNPMIYFTHINLKKEYLNCLDTWKEYEKNENNRIH